MAATPGPVYFTDENTLGLGKLLRRSGRDDVTYPGHDDLSDVPLGTLDLDWMPVVAERDLIVITRDRRIRTRPAELRVYLEYGIRSVWIGAKQDLGPQAQMEIFLMHELRLQREIVKRGPGPWALAMSPSGVRLLGLRGIEEDGRLREARGGENPWCSPRRAHRAQSEGDARRRPKWRRWTRRRRASVRP